MKLCTLIVLFFTYFGSTSYGQLSGSIYGTLSKNNSPYCVTGDIDVPLGDTLIIEAGVQMIFYGHYEFRIYGKFEAKGSRHEMIVLTAADTIVGWEGFYIDATCVDTAVFEYCHIQFGKKSGINNGGGINQKGPYTIIDHCLIEKCDAIWGGAIYLQNILGRGSLVTNTIMRLNEADDDGGGLCTWGSYDTRIENCLVYRNTAWQTGGNISGGGMRLHGDGDPDLLNTTIVNNYAPNGGGGGIGFHSNINANIVNCIIYNNELPQFTFGTNALPTITYSNIQFGYIGTGNIFSSPNFVDTNDNNYHLNNSSNSIDAGTNTGIKATDLDRNPQPYLSTNADMGAYESGYFHIDLLGSNERCLTSCDGSIQLLVSGGVAPYSYAWSNGDTIEDIDSLCSGIYVVTVTDANSTSISDSIIITHQAPMPIAKFGLADSLFCLNNSLVTFNDSSSVSCDTLLYAWNFGDGSSSTDSNPTHNYTNPGDYTIKLITTSAYACVDSTTMNIKVVDTAQILVVDTTICNGDSAKLYFNSLDSIIAVRWSPGDSITDSTSSNPTSFTKVTTDYKLQITDTNNCVSQANLEVEVKTLTLNMMPDTTICIGDSLRLGLGSNIDGLNYLWSPDSSLSIATVDSPTAYPINTTSYKAIVSTNGSCIDSATLLVNVTQIPIASAGADTAICLGDSISLGDIPSVQNTSTFLWGPPASLNDASENYPIAKPDTKTTYVLQAVNNCGFDNDSIIVDVHQKYLSLASYGDTTIKRGDEASIGMKGALSITWTPNSELDCDDCPNIKVKADTSTLYFINGSDSAGCPFMDSVLVNVVIKPCDFNPSFMPNTFTPNGDGINDYFPNLQFEETCPLQSITIYNRWGAVVYRGDEIKWDGRKENGKIASKGTYYYLIQFDASNYKGFIELL